MAKKQMTLAMALAKIEADAALIDSMAAKIVELKNEITRKEGVIRNLETWLTKYKRQAQGDKPRVADQRVDGETAAQRVIREHRERLAAH